MKIHKTLVVEVHLSTKELLEFLRALNTANRPLSNGHVLELKRAIQAGQFKVNGDTIVISSDGRLLNGQHRIEALIESETYGHPLIIVFGIDPSAFDTIDQGYKRTIAQLLAMAGYDKSSGFLGQLSSALWRWANGALGTGKYPPTNTERFAVIQKHAEQAVKSMQFAVANDPDRIMSPSLCAFLHFAGCFNGWQAETEDFLLKVIKLEGLQAGDPPLEYRQYITKYYTAKRQTAHKKNEPTAFGFKALNAHFAGQKITILKMGKNESFPELLKREGVAQ